MPPVLTLSSPVTLRFTTDYSVVAKGFSVTFATIRKLVSCICRFDLHRTYQCTAAAAPNVSRRWFVLAANCGGLIVGSGVIQTPFYPSAYSDNLVCVWGVVAKSSQTLTIDFQSFNIESNYDWLEIYDGDSLVAR